MREGCHIKHCNSQKEKVTQLSASSSYNRRGSKFNKDDTSADHERETK